MLSCPLPQPLVLPFYGGERTILKRDAMLIRVETDRHLVGYAPGPASEWAEAQIRLTIAPFLTGRTLADTDALRVQFVGTNPSPEVLKLYSTVEIALFDLLGKAMGVPVSEIAGGRVRDRIRLYGSAGMYQEPAQYGEEAARMIDLGFTAYKMRPGIGPDSDVKAVAGARNAMGPDHCLMVDAHTWWRMGNKSYSPETVERVAAAMAEYDLTWLEEPLPPHAHDAYTLLREQQLVPLASGEHEPGEQEFLHLILTGCVDYAQMDVICQGGFGMARRLLTEIQKENLRFAFHSWGTLLEVIVAGHLGITYPETVTEWLEYPVYSNEIMYPFPLAAELLKEPLEIERGELVVSREPGLGVEIDERVIERYPWIPGPWSLFRIDNPPETLAVIADHSIPWQTT